MTYSFTVSTGPLYRQTVKAARPDLAVIKAFKRSAPQACGIITRIQGRSKAVKAKFHDVDFYCDTEHFLKLAGYKVDNK